MKCDWKIKKARKIVKKQKKRTKLIKKEENRLKIERTIKFVKRKKWRNLIKILFKKG